MHQLAVDQALTDLDTLDDLILTRTANVELEVRFQFTHELHRSPVSEQS